jgi:hypothetical protein
MNSNNALGPFMKDSIFYYEEKKTKQTTVSKLIIFKVQVGVELDLPSGKFI